MNDLTVGIEAKGTVTGNLNVVYGKDGKDGNDGVSVTHEWDGTTLKVTSASGTSSADLKGEKGERGIAGVYVGEEEPTDPNISVWINPDETESLSYFGMRYADAEQAVDLNTDKTVKMYLFATNDGYDAVVSGTGAIENGDVTVNSYMDIKEDNRPHKDYVGKITRLHIEKGITSIGNYFMLAAFRLQKLTFADSGAITHLGAYAFAQTMIDGKYEFANLDDDFNCVFWSCPKLEGVTLSKNVKTVPASCFNKCHALRYVRGLSGVTTVKESAFSNCYNLEDVELNPAQVTLSDGAFVHISSDAKIKGTKTLLMNAQWHSQGTDCFTQKEWGANLAAVKSTTGESVTLPLPVFDSQCEPFYRTWKIIWVDIPYDSETGTDPALAKRAVRSGGCGLFTYYHIYNSLHSDAQYSSFKDFVERYIFTKEIEVTQELYDALNASEIGRGLMEKNTAVSYAVGAKINAFDLPHALDYSEGTENEPVGSIFWGFRQACEFEETTVYASDFENGVSNMKKAMIEALHEGKPIKLSRPSHGMGVFGYDKDSDKFLIYDSTSFLPTAQYANVYWAHLEAVTSSKSTYGRCQIITEEKMTMNDIDKKLDDIWKSASVRVLTGSFTPTEKLTALHLPIPDGVQLLEMFPEAEPKADSTSKGPLVFLSASASLQNNLGETSYASKGATIKMSLKKTDGTVAYYGGRYGFDNTNGFDISGLSGTYFADGTTYNWTAYYWD